MTTEGLSLSDAFEQIKWEFRSMLGNYQDFLTKARSEAQDRHSKLAIAKVKRDALQYEHTRTRHAGSAHLRSVPPRSPLMLLCLLSFFFLALSSLFSEELGRPERYADKLEGLVNRALNLEVTDPHQYFSASMSRKLMKQLNKEQVRKGMQDNTAEIEKQLDISPLGRKAHEIVAERGGPPVPAVLAEHDAEQKEANLKRVAALAAQPAGGLMPAPHNPIQPELPSTAAKIAAGEALVAATRVLHALDGSSTGAGSSGASIFPTPVSSLPVTSIGEPVPRPELFFHKEREWATAIHNGPEKNSLGQKKDKRMVEFIRHLDRMTAAKDATLVDYLAYVLTTQIRVLGAKKLIPWRPYTDYLDSRIFFHAYRLIHTGNERSSVWTAGPRPLTIRPNFAINPRTKKPRSPKHAAELTKQLRTKLQSKGLNQYNAAFTRAKVYDKSTGRMTFQQAVTHARLLTLLSSHLAAAPLHSFRDDEAAPPPPPRDSGYIPPPSLPLTPLWQEIVDEKVRYKHPGESWYNSRIEEVKQMESEVQEYERRERIQMQKWAEERGKVLSGKNE